MSFDDPRYPGFLVLVIVAIGLTPAGRVRLIALISASALFYLLIEPAWFVLPLVAVTAYAGGILLTRLSEGYPRVIAFVGSSTAALLPLLFYKYSPSLSELRNDDGYWSTLHNLILPIGLSFYTFMALGYLIDVYVGNVPVERDAIRFVSFMTFFPQLTAGPIGRSAQLLPQFQRLGCFDAARARSGLRAILLGAFMKIVIADNLAPYVDMAYANPSAFGARDLALATMFFSFQVYGDFAGYSLIAIGSARLLGIELMPNFQQPYLSQTLPEYWRRWHISLSSWFRDYVFIPLQFRMRRSGKLGLAAALVFTFTLVGMWHGAGWKYTIFGLIHGALVAYSTLTIAKRDKAWRRVGIPAPVLYVFRAILTFSIITLTFVLFRASDVHSAMLIYGKFWRLDPSRDALPLLYPLIGISILIGGDLIVANGYSWDRLRASVRWTTYYVLVLAIFLSALLNSKSHEQGFIYFAF